MTSDWILQIQNNIPELTRVHAWLEEIRTTHVIGGGDVFALTLALDELLTNTISYGYDDTASHDITVTLRVDDGRAYVCIDDDAREFDPLRAEKPDIDAPLEERRIGGLGIHLVTTMMDRVEYRREGGHNIIRLEKVLNPEA